MLSEPLAGGGSGSGAVEGGGLIVVPPPSPSPELCHRLADALSEHIGSAYEVDAQAALLGALLRLGVYSDDVADTAAEDLAGQSVSQPVHQ